MASTSELISRAIARRRMGRGGGATRRRLRGVDPSLFSPMATTNPPGAEPDPELPAPAASEGGDYDPLSQAIARYASGVFGDRTLQRLYQGNFPAFVPMASVTKADEIKRRSAKARGRGY